MKRKLLLGFVVGGSLLVGAGAYIPGLIPARNLADLVSVPTALINLGLNTANALKVSAGGVVQQAACGDLSNGVASCSTDTTVASNISSGTLPAARLPALTGDVTSTVNTAATTLAAGSASVLNSGTLLAARLPALTGDVTSTVNTAATTLAAGSASVLNSGTLLAARMPALTGDTTTSAGAVATTTAKVNGVAYPASPSTHQIPVVTASNTVTYKTIPDCVDNGATHLNYTSSTDTFACGASVNKTISFTRDISTATGTQAITGFGFKPRHCRAAASVNTVAGMSVSDIDSAGTAGGIAQATDGLTAWAPIAFFIYYGNGAGTTGNSGDLSSYDTDGLTIAFTKYGTPTGTLTVKLMCNA